MMTTSEGLAKYPPNRRQCYFNNERSLQFFRVYTQNNCELECFANLTLKMCGCVKFSMPRTNSTKICGQKDLECYKKMKDGLLQQEVDMSLASDNNEVQSERTPCDCLPACTSISYDAELLIVQPNFKSLHKNHATYSFGVQYDMSATLALTIFFKEAQFITSTNSEVYGWIDFMAHCGGLLGETI